jgi:octaprenyl-diphosphate synthase
MQLSAKTSGVSASDSASGGRTFGAFSIITDELSQVRSLMERESSDCNETVRGLVAQTQAGRGKMIRPGLVLLSGLSCGRLTEEHIRAAAIIEMIHNATLLHDDVIDESKSRRGVATVNHLRGNESAVLLGDFLLSRVIRLCATMDGVMMKAISTAAAQTCEGELRQIAQRGNWQLSESGYIEIIAQKTASLFDAACKIGAILTGAGERQVRGLTEYGQKTGIAFQITDDLLDLTGDEDKTGKPAGNDINDGKMTLAMIHYFNSAGEKEKAKALKGIKSRRSGFRRARTALAKKLAEHGSIDYARHRAEQFCREAINSLNVLKSTKAKDALIETAGFISNRTA